MKRIIFFQSLFQTVSSMQPQLMHFIEQQELEKGECAYRINACMSHENRHLSLQ
jgi:hypothetical protein